MSWSQVDVTRFGASVLRAREFLVSSEKELKDGHRGDLSRPGLSVQSKVKAKQKCPHPDGRWGAHKGALLGVLQFLRGLWTWGFQY
jgi:hypothetical protein